VAHSLNRIQQRVKNAFVGMDVIVGFPTETREQFEDTYLTLADLPWTKIHVFPYSERPGTRAATYSETVPLQERQRRGSRVRELSLQRFETLAKQQIHTQKKVLVLKNSAKGGQALSRDYWPVQILGAEEFVSHWVGQEVEVKIVNYDHSNKARMEGHLVGEVLT
jgi:threonylcarbamoyladenosine tRNA methylthiotransferase MtaB